MLDMTQTQDPPESRVVPLRTQTEASDIGPVIQYWNRLRNGRTVPPRSEIDPRGLSAYIGQSGIVERRPDGAVKVRLAGRQLQGLYGTELRGLPLRSLFAVAHRARLEELLREMFEGPRLLTMTLTARFEGQPLVIARMALMPLSDLNGEITRALMVLTPQAKPAHVPCRFQIQHAHLALIAPQPEARPKGDPRRERAKFSVIEGGRP